MKIAYICTDDPYNKHSWSGTNYYVRQSIEAQGHEVYCIYGYKPHLTFLYQLKMYLARIFGKRYLPRRNKQTSLQWAGYIKKNIISGTDVIFSIGTTPVACLEVDIPICILVDGIFEQMRHFYQWNDLASRCVKESNELEQSALNKCKKVISCSKETGKCIMDYYNVPKEKLAIIPLGANLDIVPDRDFIFRSILTRDKMVCHLLFVGVEWERKGADIVLAATKILHERGMRVTLHLCGLKQVPVELPSYVVNHGFLRKSEKNEFEQLLILYRTSHFLFVPSLAEAYGLVFCEASAYGLPSISHRLGGLTTIVEDDINGKLFEIGTPPEVFADYIENEFADNEKYIKLSQKSRLRFEELLNWDVAGKSMSALMEGVKI